jgi:hypothetical protein
MGTQTDGSLMLVVPTVGCLTATRREFSLDLVRRIEPLARVARLSVDAPKCVIAARLVPPTPPASLAAPFPFPEQVMRAEVAPPLAANMNAAFKKVRGALGGPDDDDLRELIVDRIVALAKDGVYDIEELASRTLSSLMK